MTYTIPHYPTDMIDVLRLPDGRRVTVRPVLPQDADLTQALVRGLSNASRMARFFAPVRELSPAWLARFTQLDYRQHMALIAEAFVDGRPVPVGEARYASDADADPADGPEFAVLVTDAWQRRGVGRQLLRSLVAHAQRTRQPAMHGMAMAGNLAMQRLALELGFELTREPGEVGFVKAVRRFGTPAPARAGAAGVAPARHAIVCQRPRGPLGEHPGARIAGPAAPALAAPDA